MPEPTEPTQPPPVNTVIDLADRFGGVTKIPDDELSKAGYKRLGEGRVVPLGFMEMTTSLGEKDRNVPFELFSIEVDRNDNTVRRLSEEQAEIVARKIMSLARPYNFQSNQTSALTEFLPGNNPINPFFTEFRAFLEGYIGEDEGAITRDIFYDFSYEAIYELLVGEEFDEFSEGDVFIENLYERDENMNRYITPGNVETISTEVERFRGRLGDVSELSRLFNE